eukprot:g2908.t1
MLMVFRGVGTYDWLLARQAVQNKRRKEAIAKRRRLREEAEKKRAAGDGSGVAVPVLTEVEMTTINE